MSADATEKPLWGAPVGEDLALEAAPPMITDPSMVVTLRISAASRSRWSQWPSLRQDGSPLVRPETGIPLAKRGKALLNGKGVEQWFFARKIWSVYVQSFSIFINLRQ